MAERHHGWVWGAVVALVGALPVTIALTDAHLGSAPASLALSTAAGALAVAVLAVQPLLAMLGPRIRWHRALGLGALALVLVHVGVLLVTETDDALFAMSPDGPTRARMALLGTLALVAVVVLGVGRERLPLTPAGWRILHAYFATLVVVLGVGHAVLTDGAMDGAGTGVLLALGVAALVGIATAQVVGARAGARP